MSGKSLSLQLAVCFLLTGCGGSGPLVIKEKQPHYAPWCGPQQRARVGQRVVGQVVDGSKYRDFLVDDAGKEHDPEQIAKEAWSYLERTGDAAKIANAFTRDAHQTTMPVVSVNPIIVIIETHFAADWQKQNRDFGKNDWYWRAQIQPNSNPHFSEEMQWFSPELKQPPTKLNFSDAGVAEISLPQGKIILVRDGDACKTTRE